MNDQTRAAWLNQIQIENDCLPTNPGQPCHSHKCACALEQQFLIDEFRANITLTTKEPEHGG